MKISKMNGNFALTFFGVALAIGSLQAHALTAGDMKKTWNPESGAGYLSTDERSCFTSGKAGCDASTTSGLNWKQNNELNLRKTNTSLAKGIRKDQINTSEQTQLKAEYDALRAKYAEFMADKKISKEERAEIEALRKKYERNVYDYRSNDVILDKTAADLKKAASKVENDRDVTDAELGLVRSKIKAWEEKYAAANKDGVISAEERAALIADRNEILNTINYYDGYKAKKLKAGMIDDIMDDFDERVASCFAEGKIDQQELDKLKAQLEDLREAQAAMIKSGNKLKKKERKAVDKQMQAFMNELSGPKGSCWVDRTNPNATVESQQAKYAEKEKEEAGSSKEAK